MKRVMPGSKRALAHLGHLGGSLGHFGHCGHVGRLGHKFHRGYLGHSGHLGHVRSFSVNEAIWARGLLGPLVPRCHFGYLYSKWRFRRTVQFWNEAESESRQGWSQ